MKARPPARVIERFTREEIALRIFCTMLANGSTVSIATGNLGENEVRVAFALATTFEKVSDEVGGRPVVTIGQPRSWEDADDED